MFILVLVEELQCYVLLLHGPDRGESLKRHGEMRIHRTPSCTIEKIHTRPKNKKKKTSKFTNGLQSLDFSGSFQKVLPKREENDGKKDDWDSQPVVGSNGGQNDGHTPPEKLEEY